MDIPASTAAQLTGLNRNTVQSIYMKLRQRVVGIACLEAEEMTGRIERYDIQVIICDMGVWPTVENTLPLLCAAMTEQVRWKLSLCNAIIFAAVRSSGSTELISEDFNHGQDYEGICAINPFKN